MAFGQPLHVPPKGCEEYDLVGKDDLGALSEQQQVKLNAYKIQARRSNELYLREHPEVECLVSSFLGSVLLNQPPNVRDYAADYFTDPTLHTKIEKRLQERLEAIDKNNLIKNM